jgi:2-hydroxy-6-oxonona-2,4-dienedioate hydrolase
MRRVCAAGDGLRVAAVGQTAYEADASALRTVWTDVCGRRMHAVAIGEGVPVVLVHGYGVSGAYMLPLARSLAGSCSAFVPDLPGQGKSEQLRGSVSLGEHADSLGSWVEANELIRPAIVANSMGCQVVTELAVRRPEVIGPMVLVGPTVDPARRGRRHQLFSALRDSAREPLSLIALAARDDLAAGPRVLLSTARAVLADRIEERLPLIEQPTVVVHGDQDAFVGREWAERVATLLPRGRLRVVPGEPHAVHYTRPELVAALVRELLVEEGKHRVRQLPRSLEHRHVPALEVGEPGVGQRLMPLIRDVEGHEPVTLAPDEQGRRVDSRQLGS